MRTKGQVALEYILAIAVLLVMLAITVAYSFSLYYDTVNTDQLTSSLRKLEMGAEHVYSLGPGNIIFVDIVLPNGVTASKVMQGQGQSIILFESSGIQSETIVDVNVTNLATKPLPSSPGAYTIKIEADANGEGVTISNAT